MRKRKLVLAMVVALGISAGAGTSVISLAAENITETQEDVFGDGLSDMEAENTETELEDGFSAGETQTLGENTEIFRDEESTADIEDNEALADAGTANSEEDFAYKVNGADRYVEIQEYVGTSSEVIIPSTIKGYPVRVVDGLDKDVIRRLVIPDSVVTLKSRIGKNIEDVSLPDSLTTLPDWCFSGCKNLRYVKIPSKVTRIPNGAFSKSAIEKIDFPENLTVIGGGAFEGCAFETFYVPDSVQTIGRDAFSYCKNLKEIKLPESLTELSYGIFQGDNCLEKVNYLPNLQTVGNSAFSGTAISTITFSKTVEKINGDLYYYDSPFYNCKNLKYIVCRGNILKKWPADITVFALSSELRNCPPYGDSYPIDSPVNMKLVQKDNQITFSWDAVSYIAGYKVYRSDSENGDYQQVADITDNTYTETINEDQRYYYKVCVYYNFNGDVVEGNFSTIVDNVPVSMRECRYAYAGKIPTYTGSPLTLDLKVTYEGQTLAQGKDYTITKYQNNTNAGTAYVFVKGKGRFKDECQISFKIQPRNISEAKFSQINKMPYTGTAIKPKVTISYGKISKTLKNGKDYSISYKNNVAIGTASIIIKGKGNFTGSKTLKFSIIKTKPETPVISSIVASEPEELTITWKKAKRAQGYEVYRKKEKSSKYYKIDTISNANTTKLTDYGVYGGVTYTYRIRSYYVLNGKKVYSSYSAPKSKTAKNQPLCTGTYSYSEGRVEWFVTIYKSGGRYYAEVGRNHTFDRTTYKLTDCGTNYYGKNGNWEVYIIGDGYDGLWMCFNDEDYEYYS